MKIYRALARMLSYPDAGMCDGIGEIRSAVAGAGALLPHMREALDATLAAMAAVDPLELQERYVATFDRIRSLSLHLFEHVHGDSRDRGAAMIDLVELYRNHGLDVTARELPDYLPLFLEFLSVIRAEEARALLSDTAQILTLLHDRLRKRNSPYAVTFAALLHLADTVPVATDEPIEEFDLTALDRAWEEAAVTFGPENNPVAGANADCGRASAMVERMNAASGARR